jgi:hypothetical protein
MAGQANGGQVVAPINSSNSQTGGAYGGQTVAPAMPGAVPNTLPGFGKNGKPLPATPEYMKGFQGLNGQAGTMDSRMYTLNGEQKFGGSSYIAALTKHLESIGQGDLLKGGTYTPTAQPPTNIAPPTGVQPPPTVAQPNINTLAAEGIKAAGATTAQGLSFNPQQVTANQLATTNMSPYTNPYEDAVVKATQDDMLRSNNINRDQLGAQASMANAFGGSRHGIAMSENDRNMTEQMARATAGLRQAGFQNAQNQAQYDINNNLQGQMANQSAGLQGNQQRMGAANQMGSLANLGFNMGQTVNSNMAQQGAMQQALQQAIYDNAQGKFGQFTGQPVNSLGYLNNALGVTPSVGSETLTSKKGLFDYLTLGASLMGG